jgi:uncharacterized protein
MKDSTVIFGTIILVLGLLFYGANSNLPERTISVSGSANKEISPDLFRVNIGAEIIRNDSRAAEIEVNRIIEEFKLELKSLGLEDSIKRENYYVNPVYDYSSRDIQITGYTVHRTLELEVLDVSLAGTVLEAASKSNANRVNNLRFDLSDEAKNNLRKDLLSEAMKDSELEAKAALRATKGRLGKVVNVNVNQNYYPMYARSLAASDMAMPEISIEPGIVSSSVSVNVVYSIR